MADFKKFFAFIQQPGMEGGFVNDPADSGGATKYGVTLATWQQYGADKNGDGLINTADIMLLTQADAAGIAKKRFWDYIKADSINSQEIAMLIADWGWASGPVTAVKGVQQQLGIPADGIVGPQTLAAINSARPVVLFAYLLADRITFVEMLVKRREKDLRFQEGWLKRILLLPNPARVG